MSVNLCQSCGGNGVVPIPGGIATCATCCGAGERTFARECVILEQQITELQRLLAEAQDDNSGLQGRFQGLSDSISSFGVEMLKKEADLQTARAEIERLNGLIETAVFDANGFKKERDQLRAGIEEVRRAAEIHGTSWIADRLKALLT